MPPWLEAVGKEGSTGFGCSTNELPIGPRKGSNSVTSAVWYEVRGANPSLADTIVLGGDVRVPEADSAVRAKMIELAGKLLEKLNLRLDDDLRGAIEATAFPSGAQDLMWSAMHRRWWGRFGRTG